MSNDNTIQNSFFNDVNPNGRVLDIINITLMDGSSYTKNIKIINNEFRNFKAVKLHDNNSGHGSDGKYMPSNGYNLHFNGFIFDSNIIWYNNDVRTDKNGNPDIDGNYAAVEAEALGIKSGSDNPNDPIIISNNIKWGGLKTHNRKGTVLSSPAAGFVTAYMRSKYVHFKGNLLFDMDRGITISDRYDEKIGTWGAVLENNIFYNLGKNIESKRGGAILLSQAEDMIVKNNLVKDIKL